MPLKKFTFYLIGGLCTFLGTVQSVRGQVTYPPKPAGCATAVAGKTLGGDFQLGGINSGAYTFDNAESYYGIIPQGTLAVASSAIPADQTKTYGYIWNVTANTNFTSFPQGVQSPLMNEGTYWVAQGETSGGNTYVCRRLTLFKDNPIIATAVICGSGTVKVTIYGRTSQPTNNHHAYTIYWADGSFTDTPANLNGADIQETKQYNVGVTPLNATIKVIGKYLDQNGNLVATNFAAANVQPRLQTKTYLSKLTTADNKQGYVIEFADKNGSDKITVEQQLAKGGVWSSAGETVTNEVRLASGFTATEKYCFRGQYKDECGVSATTNEVCSIHLNATVYSSEEVKLDWNLPERPTAISRNEIYKNTLPLGNNPITKTTFFDSRADCATANPYQTAINVNESIDGQMKQVEIVSNKVIIDNSQASRPPAPLIPLLATHTSDGTNGIILQATAVEWVKKEFEFYRADAGSTNFTSIGSNSASNYNDVGADASKSYCYRYTYTDRCNKKSEPSAIYCSVNLHENPPQRLAWTEPSDENAIQPIQALGYEIFYKDASNILQQIPPKLQSPIINSPNAIPDALATIGGGIDKITFHVVAEGVFTYLNMASGKEDTELKRLYSNLYDYLLPAGIWIPTAFSPNDDGVNDVFEARLQFVNNWKLYVFNEWGQLIFVSNETNTYWDGKLPNGQPAPIGSYVYRFTAKSTTGVDFERKGTVSLLR